LLKEPKKSSRRARTGIRDHFCNRVAFPDRDQKHLCSRRILENVVGVCTAFYFIEAGTAWIGARRAPCSQKFAQFRNLLLRMSSQVFQQRRLFCHWNRHCIAPPHASLSSPHILRRRKPENVSWLTIICLPCTSAIKWTNWPGTTAKLHENAHFAVKKRFCANLRLCHLIFAKPRHDQDASNRTNPPESPNAAGAPRVACYLCVNHISRSPSAHFLV